jgi:hypothetical protein
MSQRGGSQSAALAVDSSAVTGALTNVIQQREQQFAKVGMQLHLKKAATMAVVTPAGTCAHLQHIETARTQLLDVALTVSDMGSSELVSLV